MIVQFISPESSEKVLIDLGRRNSKIFECDSSHNLWTTIAFIENESISGTSAFVVDNPALLLYVAFEIFIQKRRVKERWWTIEHLWMSR